MKIALFDIDGTLIRGPSMEKLLTWHLLKRRFISPGDLARFAAGLLSNGGMETTRMHLRGKPAGELEVLARECYEILVRPRILSGARELVESHLEKGELVVLLTGSLEVIARWVKAELGAHGLIASHLEVSGGILTGRLDPPRPFGPRKLMLARAIAGELGIELGECYAYGDRLSDAPLLACVGYPRAVNPDPALATLARQMGWPVIHLR